MADLVATRAKGRYAEWVERVLGNDPVNAVMVVDVLAVAGIETDTVLRQKDDFAALVAGTTNFVTQASIRKTYDQAGAWTVTYDDTNHRVDVDSPDITWTAVPAGDGWGDVVTGYDSDSTAGTDAAILFGTIHDFVITPDASDITAQTPNPIFRAS